MIADANLDLIEAVEDVELRQGQAVDAAGPHGLPYQHRVEPAATSGPPGYDAEFLAAFTQRASYFVLLLRRKRAFADAGCVGLADPEHVVDRAGAEPRSGRCLRRHRVRRGHERVGAVIDVEEGALRALE